jgi:hypothetical protein
MTIHFRVLRAMAVSIALSAPGASIALADSPASLQAGAPAVAYTAQAPSTLVVPNNGLCGAQYGVPMADCDKPNAAQHAKGAANGVDYQGFPYNLSSGG